MTGPDSAFPGCCPQCGAALTKKGNCSRSVGLFSKPATEPPPLDPVIADLISEHITPTSPVGKAIARRIFELRSPND